MKVMEGDRKSLEKAVIALGSTETTWLIHDIITSPSFPNANVQLLLTVWDSIVWCAIVMK